MCQKSLDERRRKKNDTAYHLHFKIFVKKTYKNKSNERPKEFLTEKKIFQMNKIYFLHFMACMTKLDHFVFLSSLLLHV